MFNIDYNNCTGCTACKSICPVNAINLLFNERGFKYPVINNNKCIDCGLCEQVCSCYEKEIKSPNRLDNQELYIAEHMDKDTQKLSQSGAVSFALGTEIIARGGTVYGCVYDENCKAIHRRCSTIQELEDTRGSKYVQSDLKETFTEVLSDLKSNKEVLFTGTSCQMEGLYLYLQAKKTNCDKLYTTDIICHGVPSPKVLEDFKVYTESKYNQKVKKIILRDNNCLPNMYSTIVLENKQISNLYYLDIFYSNIALRECCGNCQYTTFDKPADITMGDIIGIDPKYSVLIDKKLPPSIVIVHSKKGQKLLHESQLILTQIQDGEFNQPNLNYPSKINHQKENFWKDYKRHGFEYVLKKYTSAGGLKTKLKRRIYKKIGLW